MGFLQNLTNRQSRVTDRYILLFTITILLLSTVIIFSTNCSNQVVSFADAGLEQVVRQAIGKTDSDIYLSDVNGIALLDASGRDISDLSGLEHCTGLTELNLNNNAIKDIELLSALKKLEELNLSQNGISDISALGDLTCLKWLSIGRNSVSDISSLSSITSLTTLILSVNHIENISALSDLDHLQTLQLHMNLVCDISVLAELTSLNELGLMGNSIISIEPLVCNSGFGTGDTVDLCGNPLDAISLETYIPQLQEEE